MASAEPRPAPKEKPPRTPRRTLITPEGVDLGVELASMGVRLAALLIDLVILFFILIALFYLLASVLFGWGAKTPPYFLIIIWLLAFFLLRNTWFVIWEMQSGGATPGKMLMKIRVAMRNGGRLTADAVFARNVSRELEMFLPFSYFIQTVFSTDSALGGWMILLILGWILFFNLFPLFNRDRLRVGDLLGGTWVVLAPRETLLPDLSRNVGQDGERFAFSQAQLDAYGVMELQVLEDVLRRKDAKVMRDVATRIRGKIAWTTIAGETDLLFLTAYYASLRERLEKRLLFGHRRKDKHDRSGLK